MSVQDNGLRWCKVDDGWTIVGPLAAVIAAARSGEAVTLKFTAVSTDYYDLGNGQGELIIVKRAKSGKVDRSARRLVTAAPAAAAPAASGGAVVRTTRRSK